MGVKNSVKNVIRPGQFRPCFFFFFFKYECEISSARLSVAGLSCGLIAQVVVRPLREREAVGSIVDTWPHHTKGIKMVPVATLLGAQHYKASTGSPLTHYIAQ